MQKKRKNKESRNENEFKDINYSKSVYSKSTINNINSSQDKNKLNSYNDINHNIYNDYSSSNNYEDYGFISSKINSLDIKSNLLFKQNFSPINNHNNMVSIQRNRSVNLLQTRYDLDFKNLRDEQEDEVEDNYYNNSHLNSLILTQSDKISLGLEHLKHTLRSTKVIFPYLNRNYEKGLHASNLAYIQDISKIKNNFYYNKELTNDITKNGFFSNPYSFTNTYQYSPNLKYSNQIGHQINLMQDDNNSRNSPNKFNFNDNNINYNHFNSTNAYSINLKKGSKYHLMKNSHNSNFFVSTYTKNMLNDKAFGFNPLNIVTNKMTDFEADSNAFFTTKILEKQNKFSNDDMINRSKEKKRNKDNIHKVVIPENLEKESENILNINNNSNCFNIDTSNLYSNFELDLNNAIIKEEQISPKVISSNGLFNTKQAFFSKNNLRDKNLYDFSERKRYNTMLNEKKKNKTVLKLPRINNVFNTTTKDVEN